MAQQTPTAAQKPQLIGRDVVVSVFFFLDFFWSSHFGVAIVVDGSSFQFDFIHRHFLRCTARRIPPPPTGISRRVQVTEKKKNRHGSQPKNAEGGGGGGWRRKGAVIVHFLCVGRKISGGNPVKTG